MTHFITARRDFIYTTLHEYRAHERLMIKKTNLSIKLCSTDKNHMELPVATTRLAAILPARRSFVISSFINFIKKYELPFNMGQLIPNSVSTIFLNFTANIT